MASLALDPAYRRVEVDEFLAMDFGGAKAELDDGIIFMMAGGSPAHARIASNLIIALGQRLRGTGCFPFGSDLATRTGVRSIRYPDVSVYCNDPNAPEKDDARLIGDPTVIFEVLSPSTEQNDERAKLPEYRALPGVKAIVLIRLADQTVRLVERTEVGWVDHVAAAEDLRLDVLGITIPHAEIFSRD